MAGRISDEQWARWEEGSWDGDAPELLAEARRARESEAALTKAVERFQRRVCSEDCVHHNLGPATHADYCKALSALIAQAEGR